MYNASFKQMFLDTVGNNTSVYIPHFNMFEPFEMEYGKDLCNFTTSQILAVYKTQNTTSLDFLYNAHVRMYKYAQFALMNNIIKDGQNHFDEINIDTIARCLDHKGVESSYITRERLGQIVAKLQNPLDKYIFYALYDGIKGNDYEELTSFKTEDYNAKTKTAVLCTGRKVFISDELIMAAKESQETYRYYIYDLDPSVVSKASGSSFDLLGSGAYKSRDRKDVSFATRAKGRGVYRILQKCLRYLGEQNDYISGQSLHDSGCIDYINRLAKEQNISGVEALQRDDVLALLKNQYGFSKQKRVNFIRKYEQFLV